jgi:hypothetical protein
MTADERRLLELLAGSAEGTTDALLTAHGFKPIHAAAAALFAIDNALRSSSTANEANSDKLVDLAATYVQTTLGSFTVREIFRDLGYDDRLIYLTIVGTLSTFVSTNTHRSPILDRAGRLQAQRRPLMNIHTFLRAFDAELAEVYARDSGTTPPAERS